MAAPTFRPPQAEKRSDAVSFGIVVCHITFVMAPIFLAAATPIGLFHIVFWAWFGISAHGLTNLMHEAAHRLVFKPGWASEFLGRWILAPLFISSFDTYRDRHWDHHRRLGEDDDTKDVYLVNIVGWNLFRLAVTCLLGKVAVQRFVGQFRAPSGNEGQVQAGSVAVRTAVFQGLVIAMLVVIGAVSSSWNLEEALTRSAVAYCFVYLYGLGSLTVFVAALRAIAEHQQGIPSGVDDGRAALRNLKTNPVTQLLLGAYGFANHAVHHQWPGIPSYRLPGAMAVWAASDPRYAPKQGYTSVLVSLWRGRV